MFSFSKAHCLTVFLLVPIATSLSAGDRPLTPDGERHEQRDLFHLFRLRLSALPREKEDLFRFEIGLGEGTTTSTPSDASPQRLVAPPGGLGAPRQAKSWPDPWESRHDSLSPVGRESRRQPEIDPLERYRDDKAFPDDNWIDGEKNAARGVRSRSSDDFLERVWLHERHLWSLHFYGGQNFTDNLADVVRADTHRHPSGLASVGAVRHGGAFFGLHEEAWWWPTWEVEYTFTRRFEDSPLNEHNIVPLRLRWDLPLGATVGRHMELSFAVSEGVSLAESIPNVEVNDRENSHEIQNFLAFDIILGLPFLGEFASFAHSTNLFFRIHHRSDVYGLYPEDGGSNTLTVGLSFGRRRTKRRW